MIKFPRKHPLMNHVDSGKKITQDEKCSNCNGKNYYQTVSVECCPDCGLFCDYWNTGPNKIYENMMDRKYREEEEREFERRLEEDRQWEDY